MKKSTATVSSLLFLGGLGSLGYLATQVREFNLFFDLRDEEACYYC